MRYVPERVPRVCRAATSPGLHSPRRARRGRCAARGAARHPAEGASRTPPPTVGCVTGRREQPRGNGAPGTVRPTRWVQAMAIARPGAMPRERRAGSRRYPAPGGKAGASREAASTTSTGAQRHAATPRRQTTPKRRGDPRPRERQRQQPQCKPRERRAGPSRYTAPGGKAGTAPQISRRARVHVSGNGSKAGSDAALAASGVGACGTWFDSGGRWVMAEGLQR